MNRRIVVVSTDGGSREDCNIYYANYLLVESATLAFDERVFKGSFKYGIIAELDDDDEECVELDRTVAYLKGLGYEVTELETVFVVAEE